MQTLASSPSRPSRRTAVRTVVPSAVANPLKDCLLRSLHCDSTPGRFGGRIRCWNELDPVFCIRR